MKVLVLAAGHGRRLRPQTWSVPKPLVWVAGMPVLGHALRLFSDLPWVSETIFVVGYLGDLIRSYVAETFPDLRVRFVAQDERLGQSHAVYQAREHLEGPLLVTYADKILEADLSPLEAGTGEAAAWTKLVSDPRPYGVAEVDRDRRVKRLIEKPAERSNRLAVVGLYYFEQARWLLSAVEEQMDQARSLSGEYYLVDAINILLEGGLQMRAEAVDVSLDCGGPAALLEANAHLLQRGRDNSDQAALRAGVVVVPPVFIDPKADVRRCVIGPDVSIAPGCAVSDSILRGSILSPGASVSEAALEKSLVGRGARIRGGFHSLNLGDHSKALLN